MIRQYSPTAGRFNFSNLPRGRALVGVLPVGAICDLDNAPGSPVMIEAWKPRDFAKCDPRSGKMRTVRIAGGHLASVRCLRSGARFEISDAHLIDRDRP